LSQFEKKIENLKDKEETNAQIMASLEEENKMLKLNSLKKRIGNDEDLQKEVDTLENEVLDDLGKRTIEIKRLGNQLKKSKLETNRANKVIGELNSKLKMREEEIQLLEAKILSLQQSIK
jgi:chromosome segregation ATPase